MDVTTIVLYCTAIILALSIIFALTWLHRLSTTFSLTYDARHPILSNGQEWEIFQEPFQRSLLYKISLQPYVEGSPSQLVFSLYDSQELEGNNFYLCPNKQVFDELILGEEDYKVLVGGPQIIEGQSLGFRFWIKIVNFALDPNSPTGFSFMFIKCQIKPK
jgi:hypothetical protein